MKHKLIPYEELAMAVKAIRKQPEVKIVMTNGCFDLLHPGHVFSLTYARAQGDILIVLINTDDYVQKLKGPGRPYFDLKNRLFMVGSLEAVTIVSPLRSADVVNALELVKPNVWVKGEDYTLNTLNQTERKIAEKYGVEIVFAPLLPDISSTKIIENIKSNAILAYQKEQSLEGDNLSFDDVTKGLPEDLNKHFSKIVTSNVQGEAKNYERNPEVLKMPDTRCIHREEQTVVNKHCGCKKKKLYCKHFQKFINFRKCTNCEHRSV